MTYPSLTVAIIGGGLSGLSLAIALHDRSIPFTLYESRSSFTEIGAGINLGPNALAAVRAIRPSLAEKVLQLARRSNGARGPNASEWMTYRYGADDTVGHREGDAVVVVSGAPTGSLTMHRQDLLALLAAEIEGMEEEGMAVFGKKLVGLVQEGELVKMEFADGTVERAGLVVGCDGIHSRVRKWLCEMNEEADGTAEPGFDDVAFYRAILPMEEIAAEFGDWVWKPTIHLSKDGYMTTYPVSGGTKLNCGALRYESSWEHESWVFPNQGHRISSEFEGWGPRMQKLLSMFPKDAGLWASFQHTKHLSKYSRGRVVIIGDGAHAMVPHQAAGASQAVEDAHILAELLSEVVRRGASRKDLEKGLSVYEIVRRPRLLKVHQHSSDARDRLFRFWGQHLTGAELEEWKRITEERLRWIMDVDVESEAVKAKRLFTELTAQIL